MKYNNKGLSTIVATLIIILLVLVATGIIWIVVRNVVQSGSESIELNAKCIESQVSATNVNVLAVNTTHTDLSVTLSREGGSDAIDGVNLVFTNLDETDSVTVEVPGNIVNLGVITRNVSISLLNPVKVGVVVYFKDSSGNNQFCQVTNSLQF